MGINMMIKGRFYAWFNDLSAHEKKVEIKKAIEKFGISKEDISFEKTK